MPTNQCRWPQFGAGGQKPVTSYELDEYRKLDEAHHIGTFLLLRAVVNCMQGQDLRTTPLPGRSESSSPRSESRGSIVVVASLASEGGYLGVSPYVAAKHAVKGLVKTCGMSNFSEPRAAANSQLSFGERTTRHSNQRCLPLVRSWSND